MSVNTGEHESQFMRAIRYILGPEVPWPYRMLLLLTIGLLVAGGVFERYALDVQLVDKALVGGGSTADGNNELQPALQETLNYRKKQYDRLVKGADTMFDFAKVAFGALVGGLSALIGTRSKNGAKTQKPT